MICGWDSIITPTMQIHTSNGLVRPRVNQVFLWPFSIAMLNYQRITSDHQRVIDGMVLVIDLDGVVEVSDCDKNSSPRSLL